MAKGVYDIPFDSNGNLLSRITYWDMKNPNNKLVWKPNYRFTDELEYTGYSMGRGGARIHFASVTDKRKYHMSLGDFDDCVRADIFNNKKISGEFTFVKRGTSYMMKPLLP